MYRIVGLAEIPIFCGMGELFKFKGLRCFLIEVKLSSLPFLVRIVPSDRLDKLSVVGAVTEQVQI